MKGRQGFTLMELLVVLLIIGILSTVALRTIDATRDRALFDQTTTEMNKLVQAIVGNPDLTYDGRRVDFGYYGDMEELPNDPHDLVINPGSPYWHGPYFKLMSVGDTASYRYDGWGGPYTFLWGSGQISSYGNGKFPMSVKIVDTLTQLTDNSICGTITDIDGSPPGMDTSHFRVRMDYNNPPVHPAASAQVTPLPGGYYKIALTDTAWPRWEVPIGVHKLVAVANTDSLVRYVTVLPRSKTVVDFKFSTSFWNKLQLAGTPDPNLDSSGFRFWVINNGTQNIRVDSLRFLPTSASLYMRAFGIGSQNIAKGTGESGTGPGDTLQFAAVTIAPKDLVELRFADFHVDSVPPVGELGIRVTGYTFKFRFSDGSEITVVGP